jgi:hypothetical protein
MFLENIVFDAVAPRDLGRFWEAALGLEPLTDEPDAYETRLTVPDGPVLDLCFQRVSDPERGPQRVHLDLSGGLQQDAVVERLLELGARHADIGQGDVPWVVLDDPEGDHLCVLEDREVYAATGPLAAVVLDSADPERDRDFWAWLTGWRPADGSDLPAVQHPSGLGPWVEFLPESAPKGDAKSRIHLDVRLEAGEDADEVARAIADRGGRELHFDWGDLPWRLFADPSGNEFCVLRAQG